MTKPCNFPGRKNDRRKRALARIGKKLNEDAALREAAALYRAIKPDEVARATRTKKWRGDRAKFRAA